MEGVVAITDRLMASVGAETVFRDMGFETSAISASGMILCAFHDDGRNPSCSIDLEAGLFHCFGCGKEGDLVSGWGLAKGIPYGPPLFKAIEERFLNNGHSLPSVAPAPRLPAVVTDPAALDARLASVLASSEAVTVSPDICALYEVRKYKSTKATGLLYAVRDPATGLLCDIKRRQLAPLPDPRFKSLSATPFCTLCSEPHPRSHPLFKDHASHLLRAHAGLFGYKALLAYPDHRPLLCAGEKDALRGATVLLKHGVLPIAWSAGEASDPEGLAPLLKNRPTDILYDADEAGVREAPLRAAYLSALGVVASVFPWSSVPPPVLAQGQKDLFDWLKAGGSPEDLARAITKPPTAPAPTPGPVAPSPEPDPIDSDIDLDDPLGTASHFVLDRFHAMNSPTLVRWQGRYWSWRGSHYSRYEDEGIRTEIYRFLRDNGENGTDKKVNKIADALRSVTYHSGESHAPAWLQRTDDTPPDRLIGFKNCLFDTLTNRIYPHSPVYFNHAALPFDYDPKAPTPINWLAFLDSLWRDDPDTIMLLQEMLGYLIGPDTHFQKFFYLYGPSGSGKGTIGRVLRHIIGPENCGAQQLSAFEQHFGMQSLIGKSVCILDDVRWSPKADNQKITQAILSISGEGALTLGRKNIDDWTGFLGTRLVFISNELIKLPDVASALSRRNIPIHFRKTFVGNEDTGLTARLYKEATGIINWALEGRARLMERGSFVMRGSSAELHSRFEAATNSLRRFQSECCEFVAGEGDLLTTFYGVYQKWCIENGVEHPVTQQDFENKMLDSSPFIGVTWDRATRKRTFSGVRLVGGALTLLYGGASSGGGNPSYTRD